MRFLAAAIVVLSCTFTATAEPAREIAVARRKADPFGSPRPARDQQHVPLRSSLLIELEVKPAEADDPVLAESVTIELTAPDGTKRPIVSSGRQFAPGYVGSMKNAKHRKATRFVIYVDANTPLEPSTRYTISVDARTRGGARIRG